MIQAAPLVRSRTYEVDFRFLAVPEGMTKESHRWLAGHVQSSLVYPEKLRDRERWVVFKNHRYLVCGIVCENGQLARNSGNPLAKDCMGRNTYLFAGYVFKAPFQAGLFLPRKIELFVPLLDYVGKHWEETESRRGAVEEKFDIELGGFQAVTNSTMQANTFDDRIKIWPPGREDDLWAAAFRTVGDLAVCTGLPSRRYALDSTFTEASIDGCVEPQTLRRPRSPLPSPEEDKTWPAIPDGTSNLQVSSYVEIAYGRNESPQASVRPDDQERLRVSSQSEEHNWLEGPAKIIGKGLASINPFASKKPKDSIAETKTRNQQGSVQRVHRLGIKYKDEKDGDPN